MPATTYNFRITFIDATAVARTVYSTSWADLATFLNSLSIPGLPPQTGINSLTITVIEPSGVEWPLTFF